MGIRGRANLTDKRNPAPAATWGPGCRNKRRYTSRRQALGRLRVERRQPGYETLVEYRCTACRGWHLGNVQDRGSTMATMKGKIVRIIADKGFGFIRGEDGIERFFHRSGVEQTGRQLEELRVGESVHFTPIDDAPKGPRAMEVRAA